jgi:hypothetical protein
MAVDAEIQRFFRVLGGGFERESGVDVRFRRGLAMRASGTAGLGASAQSLLNDALDGAGAPAAFSAAAEAAVELLGVARKIFRGVNRAADIVVGEDVAGTNNHGTLKPVSDAYVLRIGKTAAGCKRKNRIFK